MIPFTLPTSPITLTIGILIHMVVVVVTTVEEEIQVGKEPVRAIVIQISYQGMKINANFMELTFGNQVG
jgi:hypothetical protein